MKNPIILEESWPYGKQVYRPAPSCSILARRDYELLLEIVGQKTLIPAQMKLLENLGFSFQIVPSSYQKDTVNIIIQYSIHTLQNGSLVAVGSIKTQRDFFEDKDWADKLINSIRKLPADCDVLVPRNFAELSADKTSGMIEFPTFRLAFKVTSRG